MANLFIRTYTFVDGTTAYGSQVEAEVGNIVTVLNNLNTAATNWGQVSSLHATSVPLIADCSSGSQHIADFKNNSVIKASISSAGLGTFVGLAAGSQKITGLANGTAATDAAAFGQLKVLQIVFGSSTTQFSTTSSTFQATNLTASITPTSASSRILIIASGRVELAANNHVAYLTLERAGSNLGGSLGMQQLSIAIAAGAMNCPATLSFIDSPATTSATAYTVYLKNDDNATTVDFLTANQTGTMILMEIV